MSASLLRHVAVHRLALRSPELIVQLDGHDRDRRPVCVALTGASGVAYGIRLLQELVVRECPVHWTMSPTAARIVHEETDWRVDAKTGRASWFDGESEHLVTYHGPKDVGAPVASGSYPLRGAVVVPCSGGTLGRLAGGTSETLVGRMAEVCLKERWPLIIVPRETPYSRIHLTNMLALTDAGATILPACPGFYMRPDTIEEIVDFVVARILAHLGYDGRSLIKGGWGG